MRKESGKYFTQKTRVDGREFYCLKDDRPEELQKLVYDIHEIWGAMPNDWIYETIMHAFDRLEDCNWDFDELHIEPEYRYYQLFMWLADNPFARWEVDEFIGKYGVSYETNITAIISNGQVEAMEKIYRAVFDWVNEEEEEECEQD